MPSTWGYASKNGWQHMSAGVTSYHIFLNKIERWRERAQQRVVLVTFNYDRMLENAFPDALDIQI